MKYRTAATQKGAQFIRRATGTEKLEKTVERAFEALALRGIPSLVCGGLAVQEYGYPRATQDVDIIVPDVAEAYKVLSISGFRPSRETPGLVGFMIDRENKIELDLLPAGKTIGNAKVDFPTPHTVSKTPILISLPQLVSLKLSSWESEPLRRSKDQTDVVELIMRRKLPRNLGVQESVQGIYQSLWDSLKDRQDRDPWDGKQA